MFVVRVFLPGQVVRHVLPLVLRLALERLALGPLSQFLVQVIHLLGLEFVGRVVVFVVSVVLELRARLLVAHRLVLRLLLDLPRLVLLLVAGLVLKLGSGSSVRLLVLRTVPVFLRDLFGHIVVLVDSVALEPWSLPPVRRHLLLGLGLDLVGQVLGLVRRLALERRLGTLRFLEALAVVLFHGCNYSQTVGLPLGPEVRCLYSVSSANLAGFLL